MSRTAFVHIGLSKTGTTSIQRSLARSRDCLGAAGLCYPGHRSDHAELLATVHPQAAAHHYFKVYDDGDPHQRAQRLWDEAAAARGDVILSSEYFAGLGRAGAERLRDRLAGMGFSPVIVCYLRHPVNAAISLAQQMIKMNDRSLAEVISAPPVPPIRSILGAFSAVFGVGNLRVVDFSVAASQGLLRNLMSIIGRPELTDALTVERANEGLTMDAAILCDLHRRMTQENGRPPFPRHLVFELTDSKFTLPEPTLAKVRQDGQAHVDWVRDTFGVELVEAPVSARYRPNVTPGSIMALLSAGR